MKRVTEQCNEYGLLNVKKIESEDLRGNKEKIIKYMQRRDLVIMASTSRIVDFVSNEQVDKYCRVSYSDGEFVWSSNDTHYVEKYNMKLLPEFISKVLNSKI